VEFLNLLPQRQCAFRPFHQMDDRPEAVCILMNMDVGCINTKICKVTIKDNSEKSVTT